MKAKLQEYALIAEIIGGIAIVLSLPFESLKNRGSFSIQLVSEACGQYPELEQAP